MMNRENSSLNLMVAIAVIALIVLAAHAAGIVLCPFRRITGLPCPGCGSTRAAISILRADFTGAFQLNPLTTLLIVLSPIWWFILRRKRTFSLTMVAALTFLAIAAVALNWIYLLFFTDA